MRVLHVTPSFHPATNWGGPVSFLYDLCNGLTKADGLELRVLTTDSAGPSNNDRLLIERSPTITQAGYEVFYCHRVWRASVSTELLRRLPQMVRWADLVHLSAAYSFPTIPTLTAARLLGKPLVWSPHGAFLQWAGSRRVRIKRMWEAVCYAFAPRRIVFHTLSDREGRSIPEIFRDPQTAIIPAGTTVPARFSRAPAKGSLRLAYLGRLHAIKGLENLLDACSLLAERLPTEWYLTIGGGGEEGYVKTLHRRVEDLRLSSKVRFVGEVVSQAKAGFFSEADILILPSHSENFGLVVAEALAHGVPVVTSKGTPWRGVEKVGCGVWVENKPLDLADAIVQMSRSALTEMGLRGREWAAREFSQEYVARRMHRLYQDVLGANKIKDDRSAETRLGAGEAEDRLCSGRTDHRLLHT